MGAKRGRTKGNEQRAEYENQERKHERSGWSERGNRGSESGDGNCGSHCEAEAGMAERKKQRPSSEMLKRKRTKGSRREAENPEGESVREAPEEQLWERIREGRKETNREPSTRTWKEGMRDQAGEKGESEEAKAETGTAEATVRRKRG